MSIYITNSSFLGGSGDDFNANNPIVGYHSVLTPSDITAPLGSSRPGINMWSPDTSVSWLGDDNSTQSVTLSNTSNEIVNYLGIAKHNLASEEFEVKFQYFDGSGYVDMSDFTIYSNDGSIMLYFDDSTYSSFRIVIRSTNLDPSDPAISNVRPIIGHVKLGKALVLQRRIYVGHRPATIAKKVARVTHGSENGQYLGQIVKRSFYTSEISQENNSPSFVREHIVPFINHINGDVVIEDTAPATFFFAWRPSDYPDEVVYGWTMDQISPENQGGDTMGGRMSWNCSIEAVA